MSAPSWLFGGDVRVMCESCAREPATRAVSLAAHVAPFLVCDRCAPVAGPPPLHAQLALDGTVR